jgi:GWxTD domain-containing protein
VFICGESDKMTLPVMCKLSGRGGYLFTGYRVGVRWLVLLSAFIVITGSCLAAKHESLPPKYNHWLNAEVNYIISDTEREAFLNLKADEDCDTFIKNFWATRNPDPEAPSNTFEDEHYRRLAYVNQNFGNPRVEDGWRTDRGMVYITLGPPQQRVKYPNTRYLRQMEVWFYQSPSSGLPAYFSVIFYKPSISEDYRLYSPYGDRPEKLIASTNAANNQQVALKIIQEDVGPEVAHLSLSLLPDEPVDLKEAYPSLQSDVLLNNIRNYRNLPANRELIEERRSLLEGVSHRLLLGEEFSDMFVLATRDAVHEASLQYLFRFLHPQDFSLAEQSDGRYYYALTVATELSLPDGKQIYTDSRDINGYFTSQQFAEVRNKCLGVEGRLGVAPGKYQLHLEITNKVTHQSFTQTRMVLVPDFEHSLGMSQVFFAAANNPARDLTGIKPFSFSGVKLPAIGAENTVISPGSPLRILYQLWEAPAAPETLKDKTLEVSYLIGQLGSPDKQNEKQTIARSSFNSQGNLLMGKDLSTISLHPGNYRLVIRVTDPESHESTSQALNFQISTTDSYPLWTIISPSYANPSNMTNLYRRGLCALAQQNAALATEYLKEAKETGLADSAVLRALARAYRLAGDVNNATAVEQESKRFAQLPPSSANH